jgi:DnaJ homolog subfamily A member 5
MERENRQCRTAARQEYNETIQRLSKYIQKQDPRYTKYLLEKKEAAALKEQELKKQKAEKKLARLEEFSNYNAPDWVKKAEPLQDDIIKDLLNDNELETDSQLEYYCAACEKIFKSDKQVPIFCYEKFNRCLKSVISGKTMNVLRSI